jgi:flagellar hook-associated protein 2
MAGIALSGFSNLFNSGSVLAAVMSSSSLPLISLSQQANYMQNQMQEVNYVYNQSMSVFSTMVGFVLNPITGSMTAISSNPNVLNAIAAPNTPPGTYNITVNQLAQPEISLLGSFSSLNTTLGQSGTISLFFRSDTSSSGITDNNLSATTPGVQEFNITYNGTNTLQDIVNEINNTAGSDVTASIFYNGNTYSLMLAEKQGASTFTTSPSTTQHVIVAQDSAGIFSQNYAQNAQNAVINFGGASVTSNVNQIQNVISGVTLNLSGTGSVVLSISQDTSQVSNNVSNLINEVNNILTPINVLTEKPGTYSSQNSLTSSNPFIVPGDFMGNFMLTNLKTQLLSVVQPLENLGVVNYNYQTGQLQFDSNSFQNLLSTSSQTVLNSVTAFVSSLSQAIMNIISPNGALMTEENNISSNYAYTQNQMYQMQQSLLLQQQQLQLQFSQVEAIMASSSAEINKLQTLLG